ncbi:esterase/lipase family protein [Flexivirga sp. B27]
MNDWSCKPSAAHPNPVVLVQGTWSSRYDSFAALSPALKKQGYCVFGENLGGSDAILSKFPGVYLTGPVKDSAKQLSQEVDKVLAATGAKKVDLVGWSQGGIVARGYLKFFGGANPSIPAANKVDNVVTYGATNHGTTLSGLATVAKAFGLNPALPSTLGQAAVDQEIGSDYLNELNADGDTMPGIDYTIIGSKYDEVTTPYTRTFLTAGPGATVHNITLQDGCAIDFSDHLQLAYSPRVIQMTEKALGSNVRVGCTLRTPL